MKTRQGHVQGYNAQAVVSKDQIIVGAEVTREENGLYQLEPMIQETKEGLKESGIDKRIGTCTADTGYWRNDSPVKSTEADGPELFIAVQKDGKQPRQCQGDDNSSRGRIPTDASSRDRMARKLRTKQGKAKYRPRSQSVEPVSGQIKAAMGIYGFLRRGLSAIRSEWKLIRACHNLMKLFRAFGVVTTGQEIVGQNRSDDYREPTSGKISPTPWLSDLWARNYAGRIGPLAFLPLRVLQWPHLFASLWPIASRDEFATILFTEGDF